MVVYPIEIFLTKIQTMHRFVNQLSKSHFQNKLRVISTVPQYRSKWLNNFNDIKKQLETASSTIKSASKKVLDATDKIVDYVQDPKNQKKVDKIKKDAQKVIEYVNNPKNQEAVKEFKKNAYNLTKKVGGQVTDAVKAGTRVYERYVRLKRRLIMILWMIIIFAFLYVLRPYIPFLQKIYEDITSVKRN